MNQNDLDFFKKLLEESLQEIHQKGTITNEDMNGSVEAYADPGDRATAESDRTMTLLLRDRDRKLISKIHEALGRMTDGSYGECKECGEDISIARLKARPVTTLCIKCKARQEKEEVLRGE